MKSEIKTAIILGIVIAVGIGAISIVFSSFDQVNTTNSLEKIDKTNFKKAPNLVGIAHHLNTTPEKLVDEMKDKV